MQQESKLKGKVLSGLGWRFGERAGVLAVAYVVSVVLARVLDKDDIGLRDIVMVFIVLTNVFLDEGFGAALIQKLDADELDFSSVFFFNLVFMAGLYAIIFLGAPLLAALYGNPLMTPVLRVLALNLPIAAVYSVQRAYVSRRMLFRRFFFSTLGGTLASGAVGLGMAYAGYGVWALVGQQLTNTLVSTVVLWFTVRWRPALQFSMARIKRLFSFGWKLLVASLLNNGYADLVTLITGGVYGTARLADYNNGQSMPKMLSSVVYSSVSSVLFPAISKKQQDKQVVRDIVSISVRCGAYLLFPMMLGLALVAEPLVLLIYTEKWLSSVPFLQVFCIAYALMPIHISCLAAFKALGRSDFNLKLEIAKRAVGLVMLAIGLQFGLFAVAVSLVISNVFAMFINMAPAKRLFGYSYLHQLRDLAPTLLLTAAMGAAVWLAGLLPLGPLALLAVQVATGVAVYLGLSALFKVSTFRFLLDTAREFLRNRGQNTT